MDEKKENGYLDKKSNFTFYCRLCGSWNPTGQFLNDEISSLINSYLPLKIKSNSPYPQWICPGCHLQVESTVEFFDLVVAGQEFLRSLLIERNSELSSTENNFCIDNVDNKLYNLNDKIVKRIQGTVIDDKPKRKRGRPSKLPKEIILAQQQLADDEANAKKQLEEELRNTLTIADDDDASGRKRRNIKRPSRFNEAVQGSELERIYVENGVIDKSELLHETIKLEDTDTIDYDESNIIGHMQDKNGHSLGNVVCDNNFRPTPQTKYYSSKRKTKFICDICRREFIHEHRYLAHRATHHVEYECTACERKFLQRNELSAHQIETGHIGQGIVESLDDIDNEFFFDNNSTSVSQSTETRLMIKTVNDELPSNFESKLISNTIEYDQDNVEEAAKLLYELQHMDKIIENTDADDDVNFVDQTERSSIMNESGKNINLNEIASHSSNIAVHKPLFVDCSDDVTLHDTHFNLVNSSKQISLKEDDEDSSFSQKYNGDGEKKIKQSTKKNNNNSGRRYICSKCGRIFNRKQLLQRHQQVHSSDRPYPCDKCTASFKTKPNLLNHLQIHLGIKKHECTICQQKFTHKTSLTLHYRWHSGEKPYSCDICGKKFGQMGNLKEHFRIHTGERPFTCELCNKKFKTSSQCRIHSKNIHEKSKQYECTFCKKKFIYLEVYKAHLRQHNNDKPFVCVYCSKKFSDQWSLKKHTRIHTGERPYQCNVCKKLFSDCSNLIKHKKIHDPYEIDKKKSQTKISSSTTTEAATTLLTNEGENVDDAVKLCKNLIDDNATEWTSIVKTNNSDKNSKELTKSIIYVTYQNPTNKLDSEQTLQMTSLTLPIDITEENSTLQCPIISGLPPIENSLEQITDDVDSLPIIHEQSAETIANDSSLLDNIYGQSFEIITTDGRRLRLLAPYTEQINT